MLPRAPRVLALASLLSFIWLAAPAGADQAPPRVNAPLILTGLGRATLPLDGPWQFHLGDDLRWASPSFDDSGWEQLQAGKPWDAQGHWGYTGFAWYRRRIDFAPGTAANLDLGIFLPRIDDACEVYWNGKLIGGIGKVPPHPVWYASAYPDMLAGRSASGLTLGPPQSGVLAIRVWSAPTILFASSMKGGLTSVPQLGSAQAIAAIEDSARYQWILSNQLTLAVVLLCTVVSVLCLFMGFRNRRNREIRPEGSMGRRIGDNLLFWLAVAMAFPLESLLFNGVPGLIPFRWDYGLVGIIIGIYDAAMWLVLIDLLGLRENRRLVRWTWVVIAIECGFDLLDGALQLFDWSGHPRFFLPFDFAFTLLPVCLEVWGAVLVLFAFRRHHDAARWMLAICALAANLVQSLEDLADMGQRWTHWTFNHFVDAPLFTMAGSSLNARTLTNTLLLIAILYAAWRYSVEQTERQVELEQEFRSARELQQFLIPASLPETPGFAITSAYRPAREVGGDFFQILPLDGDSALIVLGDVSGKGLKAAMAVSLIVGALRALAEDHSAPADLLAQLNRRLTGHLRGGFATCEALRIASDGRCTLASAGHPAPLLNGRELAVPGALPLGITAEADYAEIEFALAPGDHLGLYTDGLLEARSPSGELYSFERVGMLFAARPSAAEAAEAAVNFGQDDDITVLTVKRVGTGSQATLLTATATR